MDAAASAIGGLATPGAIQGDGGIPFCCGGAAVSVREHPAAAISAATNATDTAARIGIRFPIGMFIPSVQDAEAPHRVVHGRI